MPTSPDTPQDFPFTPVPRAGHGKLTAHVQRLFIAALARSGLVAEAARAVGVSVAALEKLRYAQGGESFRAAWDAARNCETARAARAARRRAGSRGMAQGPAHGSAHGSADRPAPPSPTRGAFDPSHGFALTGQAPGHSHDRHSAGGGTLHCASSRPSQRTSHVAFTGPEPAPDDPLLGFAPYLHRAPRRNSITPDRQRAFIAALAASGSVRQAARAIAASIEALYNLRARHGAEEFAAAWEKAIDLGIARLEDTALARAIEGEARPIVARGEIIGEYRVHNEALVMFLLRHRRARRYGAAEDAPPQRDERAIIESINAKLDRVRAQYETRTPGHGDSAAAVLDIRPKA